MKNKIIAAGAALAACLILASVVFARREYKAHIPVITVKEYSVHAMPGDTVDPRDLIEVKVKGEYDCKCEIEYGHESGEMDEDGVVHILDNGQSAMSTIELKYTVTGRSGTAHEDAVHIIVQNPINENNSYEASPAGVRFRIYNDLKDQGNGVFMRGDGRSDNAYEIVFHSADTVSSMDELEAQIKRYAKEKYRMSESTSDYRSEDVTLSSGKAARIITFSALRSQGEYLVPGESSGLVVNVFVYAFGEGGRYFFIDDDNAWYAKAEYEMEQIANTLA